MKRISAVCVIDCNKSNTVTRMHGITYLVIMEEGHLLALKNSVQSVYRSFSISTKSLLLRNGSRRLKTMNISSNHSQKKAEYQFAIDKAKWSSFMQDYQKDAKYCISDKFLEGFHKGGKISMFQCGNVLSTLGSAALLNLHKVFAVRMGFYPPTANFDVIILLSLLKYIYISCHFNA